MWRTRGIAFFQNQIRSGCLLAQPPKPPSPTNLKCISFRARRPQARKVGRRTQGQPIQLGGYRGETIDEVDVVTEGAVAKSRRTRGHPWSVADQVTHSPSPDCGLPHNQCQEGGTGTAVSGRTGDCTGTGTAILGAQRDWPGIGIAVLSRSKGLAENAD